MTAKELSIALGIASQNVYDHLKILGIKPLRRERIYTKKPLAPGKQFILDNYKNFSVDQLSRKTGLSLKQVKGFLSSQGLVCTKVDETTEYIFKNYKIKTVKQMALARQVSTVKVYSIMKKYDLPITSVPVVKGERLKSLPQLTIKSFSDYVTIPVGFKRLSIMVPAGSSREFIEEKKKRFLDKILKAS